MSAPHENLIAPGTARWPLDPAKPIIELTDVSLAFGDHVVLDGLSLAIPPGQITVIAGRSGAGKSTLLKVMMGLLRPDRGRVVVFGRDLSAVSPVELVELRKRMAMVFQNYALFDALSVEENVEFGLREHTHLRGPEIERLARELLATLGLHGSEALLPEALSGGMRRRVGLARALVANPEVVLLDEPTTGLDPIMVEKVDELIALAKARYELTSVIVSHDLASIRRLADRVAILDDGKIAFTGSYDELLRCELPAVRAFVARSDDRPHASPQPAVVRDAPVVELVAVHKRFGSNQVLRGVDLAIPRGLTTVLIGASGSGKSVLIKHVMGLVKPDAGKILVFGMDIVPMGEHELAKVRSRIGLVFQHAALLDWLDVEANVAFPLAERHRLSRRELRARVDEILERTNLGALRHRMPGDLSMPDRKRVGIARALIVEPEIMIYDEPTTGQDPVRAHEIDDIILETQARFAITSIVISHDMASAFRIGDRIAMLHDGRIAACGTPAEILASPDEDVHHFLEAGAIARPTEVGGREVRGDDAIPIAARQVFV
jgi:ABC-type transporter Mla maintaining outer membrane lipid asymmetry ATPase subunit MlaF